jgi:ligand-binding SRPBCC domain-containing protein
MRPENLTMIQKIPADLERVWHFFSSPDNLSVITPPSLGFHILSTFGEERIYAGQIIEYTVKPLLGIPLYWMTEITHVRDLEYFVDEQRVGPYKLWHHQHHFTVIPGGVEMTDIVHYALPLGWLGRPFLPLVRHKLDEIFSFRAQKTAELLGTWKKT